MMNDVQRPATGGKSQTMWVGHNSSLTVEVLRQALRAAAVVAVLFLAAGCVSAPVQQPSLKVEAASEAVALGTDDPAAMLLGVDPETGERLLEGDIRPAPGTRWPAIRPKSLGSGKAWPLGFIPYEVDPEYIPTSKLERAIADIERVSEIRFIPRTTEEDYILIKKSGGCSAPVGYYGSGEQVVKLNPVSCSQRSVRHELMHILGFQHEMTWSGRDLDIDVHWECIETGSSNNFQMHGGPHYCPEGDPDCGTDFLSTMMYGSSDWCDPAKAPCPAAVGCFSMTKKDGVNWGILQALTPADIAGLNKHYAIEIAKRQVCEECPREPVSGCPDCPCAVCPRPPVLGCPDCPELPLRVLELNGWTIEVSFTDPPTGEVRRATVAVTDEKSGNSGIFRFFSQAGWELLVTVLPFGDGFFLGAGGTTDLEWTLDGTGPDGEKWNIDKTGRQRSPAFIKIVP